jgi:hypothetical protein
MLRLFSILLFDYGNLAPRRLTTRTGMQPGQGGNIAAGALQVCLNFGL